MPSSNVSTFPGKMFKDGREVLGRFGYRYAQPYDLFEDWDKMWDKLKGDFSVPGKPAIPAFDDMSPAQKEAAQNYMEARLQADRRLIACEKAHREMFSDGINSDLVELYTAAREAYEDSVEHFGQHRAKLATLL